MVNRLGINQNNPFASSDRPVVRNLHLKNTDALSSRVNDLKNNTMRHSSKQGFVSDVDAQEIGTVQGIRSANRDQKIFGKKPSHHKQGSFGDIVDAVIVEDQKPKQEQKSQPRYGDNDTWVMASKMRVQRSQDELKAKPSPDRSQQEQIDKLSQEVNSLRSDLNKLMAKNEPPRQAPGSMNSHKHHPRQPSSFDRGIGYEIGNG